MLTDGSYARKVKVSMLRASSACRVIERSPLGQAWAMRDAPGSDGYSPGLSWHAVAPDFSVASPGFAYCPCVTDQGVALIVAIVRFNSCRRWFVLSYLGSNSYSRWIIKCGFRMGRDKRLNKIAPCLLYAGRLQHSWKTWLRRAISVVACAGFCYLRGLLIDDDSGSSP